MKSNRQAVKVDIKIEFRIENMLLFQALYAKDFVILCQESVCRCAEESLPEVGNLQCVVTAQT